MELLNLEIEREESGHSVAEGQLAALDQLFDSALDAFISVLDEHTLEQMIKVQRKDTRRRPPYQGRCRRRRWRSPQLGRQARIVAERKALLLNSSKERFERFQNATVALLALDSRAGNRLLTSRSACELTDTEKSFSGP